MILPTIRSSFDRADARFLIWLLTRGADAEREREEVRLRDEGLDAILDDPRTLNAILTGSQFSSARPELVFYVLVRHALLEDGITDRAVADYIDGDDSVWEQEPMQGLARDGALAAYRHRGFWQNMDTLRDKMVLEDLWTRDNPPWKVWQ